MKLRTLCALFVGTVSLLAAAIDIAAAPNLTPYSPSGWSDKIVVSKVTGTTTNSSSITTADTLYVDWAVINNGAHGIGARYWTTLYVDGTARASWYTDPPQDPFYYATLTDYSIGTLSAGQHTISIITDVLGNVAESSESDNQYSRTISVSSPNLRPYQPSGWSDRIVVSTVTGTSTDTGVLLATNALYIDWAVANVGGAATTAPFYTQLYVDGVAHANWLTNPPLDSSAYAWVADFHLGTLAPGTHTLRLVADSTGAIGEASETDNEYTKTITISAPPTVNLIPYKPSGWSDRIVVSNTTGTTTDSSPLQATDTLYVDWAVINNGGSATSTRFHTALYVDGSLRTSWYTDPPLNSNSYTSVADYSLGSLATGTHTLRIVTDSTSAVSETSESDNEYTRTITIGGGTPDIRVTPTSLSFNAGASADAPSLAADEIADGVVFDLTRVAALKARAMEQGSIRVFARLDTPFVPIGRLNAQRVAAQREAIRQAAERVTAAFQHVNRPVKRFEFIPFIALEVTADELEQLASTPGIAAIYENRASPPALASSNAVIGTATAWNAGFTGVGQAVAVLDTGVDNSHPFFSTGTNKVVAEACYSTTSSSSMSVCPGGVSSSVAPGSGGDCAASISGCNHGTHVAGIVAGNDSAGPNFGVARGANIIAIQVFSRFDSADQCGTARPPCARTWADDQVDGLERVLALRNTFAIAAANMSLGGWRYTSTAACDSDNAAVKAAIDNLRSVGIPTIIAAGNDGYRDAMGAPACISTAISVGGTEDDDDMYSASNIANWTSLLAPGVSITSSVPGTGTSPFDGTSMAAPHVAGAWALMRQANPAANIDTILGTLRNTATVLSDTRTGGTVTGLRRINVGAAVLAGSGGGNSQTFTIFNDGTAPLAVTSLALDAAASWITWSPAAPFNVAAGGSQAVTVSVDISAAPSGQTTRRLLVGSNDPDENPYPGAVVIVVNKAAALPTITIAATDNTATEAGPTTGTFTVSRTGSTSGSLTVHFGVSGTAINGSDYNSLGSSVTILAGATTATIVVTPVNDALIESNEAVEVTLTTNAAYHIGAASTATVTITSDDLAAPTDAAATANGTSAVAVSWTAAAGAASYRVYRSADGSNYTLVGSPVASPFTDTAVAPNTAYLYKVRAFATSESADSNRDVATTVVFTDPELASSRVKTVHFTELMAAINAVRLLAGQQPASLSAPSPAVGGIIIRQHLLDLRIALDAARSALGLPALSYTDPSVTARATPVRSTHITQLRDGLR